MNKEAVLEFLRGRAKPLSFREIVFLMHLSRPEARALKRILREILREGDIVLTRRGLYGPSEQMNLATGYFEGHRDGYGFVVMEKPGERDIFIPPGAKLGAMDGDRVVARIEVRKRRSGRIVRILERAFTKVQGKIEITKTAAFVKPKNKVLPFELFIAAKDRGGAIDGDNVIAEILSYPTDNRSPSGKVIKVIKKPGDPKSEIDAILEEFDLSRKFPRAVATEAKALGSAAGLSIRMKEKEDIRKDLRKIVTVTIDGERARDFDDAVSVARTDGGYRLWVHVADVGFFVPWDSELDLEARARGTSVYFPDRVIPMLPKELSEDLCSLKPDVDRMAISVRMDFDSFGVKKDVGFYPSIIKSDERMTYTSVRKILVDGDADERARYKHVLKDLELMGELCRILKAVRMERGSLDFDLPEPEIMLDMQGNPLAITRAERNFAHIIIEEFMIAANETVAEYLDKLDVPTLYRTHEEPDPMRMEDVLKVIRPMGIFKRKSFRPKDFAEILETIKGAPEKEVVNYIVLRSLKQARYSPINVGHFGLASDCYTHFTSPIRRYPDLVVHRILREVLSRKTIPEKKAGDAGPLLPEIAFHSSCMERRAEKAERAALGALTVWFMKDRVGEEFGGKVVAVTPYGLRVRLNNYYIVGFIHLSYLTDDFYQFNEKEMTLSGRHAKRSFKIGQDVRVKVERIDMEGREVIFGL